MHRDYGACKMRIRVKRPELLELDAAKSRTALGVIGGFMGFSGAVFEIFPPSSPWELIIGRSLLRITCLIQTLVSACSWRNPETERFDHLLIVSVVMLFYSLLSVAPWLWLGWKALLLLLILAALLESWRFGDLSRKRLTSTFLGVSTPGLAMMCVLFAVAHECQSAPFMIATQDSLSRVTPAVKAPA